MRAMSDAIAVGVGTAIADDPELTCRLPGMLARSPVRVVFDTHLRLPVDCKLVRTIARRAAVGDHGAGRAGRARARVAGARRRSHSRAQDEATGKLRLEGALNALAARGITSLMVEGGPILAEALLEEDLVDEATIMRGPLHDRRGRGRTRSMDCRSTHHARRRAFVLHCDEAIGADRIADYVRA